MGKPLAIDLYCGLGGWTEALLAEGWDVIGFDIERHDYGTGGYPGQLVLQDVCTLHGAQFRDADLIVASPPCQEFSYRAMPWKRAKALPPPYLGMNLFWQCWRIQYEAEEAAGREIPLIVENVVGAQKWIGGAAWHYGSFYLWGNLPPLMPVKGSIKNGTLGGGSWFGLSATNTVLGMNPDGRKIAHAAKQFDGRKMPGMSWSGSDKPGYVAKGFNVEAAKKLRDPMAASSGRGRKAASAQIAKIPQPLAQHIARVFKP